MSKPNDIILRYPSKGSPQDCVEVKNDDLRTLDSTNYLNDTIVTFYLRYIKHEVCGRDVQDKVHVFNSFFYEKLKTFWQSDLNDYCNYLKIRKWYRKIDMFNKDFLIIPVCEDQHWSLIVVCYHAHAPSIVPEKQNCISVIKPEPSILVMDSLISRRPGFTCPVRHWLDHEWRARNIDVDDFDIKFFDSSHLKEIWPELPKQDNYYDCGIYILVYCHYFMRTPNKTYDLILRSDRGISDEICKSIDKLIRTQTREKIKLMIKERAGIS